MPAVQGDRFDEPVATTLAFGGVAGCSSRCTTLSLGLGDMAEPCFRQSMPLSRGRRSIFWKNALVRLALAMPDWPLVARLKTWLQRPALAVHAQGNAS